MPKARSIVFTGLAALMLVASSGMAAQAATTCQRLNYSAELAKLHRLLSSNGFPASDQKFLLKGVGQRAGEFPRSRLNARGAGCGIRGVRASILGCLNETLPSTLRAIHSPNEKTGTAFWNKTDVTRREAAVIGMFHTCRGAAMETFLSAQ